jgi:uncharacterized FlgJ-related protein
MKPSEINPDYVKYHNEKKKKRITIHHLEQRLAHELGVLEQDKAWVKRDIDRMKVQEQVIVELKEEIRKCLR